MQSNVQSLFAVSEVELVYRTKVKPADRRKIQTSKCAYDLLLSVWDMNKIEMVEHFYVILLDRRNKCLGVSHLFTGGTSTCLVDPKIVFVAAIKANASSIVVAHNHPSGGLTPSKADDALTHKLIEGGKLLDISVFDHVIVGEDNYYSYADNLMIS